MVSFKKKYILMAVFLVGITAGSLFANKIGVYHISEWGIFSRKYISLYDSVRVEFAPLFWYILGQRMKIVVAVGVLSLTVVRCFLEYGIVGYAGFMNSVAASMAVMQYGAYGLWLFMVSTLPHFMLILAACILIMEGAKPGRSRNRNYYIRYVVVIGIALLLMILAAATEAYIDVAVLKKIM